jgi:hypothetical protein
MVAGGGWCGVLGQQQPICFGGVNPRANRELVDQLVDQTRNTLINPI